VAKAEEEEPAAARICAAEVKDRVKRDDDAAARCNACRAPEANREAMVEMQGGLVAAMGALCHSQTGEESRTHGEGPRAHISAHGTPAHARTSRRHTEPAIRARPNKHPSPLRLPLHHGTHRQTTRRKGTQTASKNAIGTQFDLICTISVHVCILYHRNCANVRLSACPVAD
jgi:hypothetical protein